MAGTTPATVPATMQAAVYHRAGEVSVEERPVPELAPHDVLLEVSHCGVCGSDLHMFVEGWARPGTIGGHEYSGRVAAVGSAVSAWAPGDEAIGGPSRKCGTCEYCNAGRPQLCSGRPAPGLSDFQGAFAEYVRVHEDEAVPVPEGVSLRAAALTEPLAVALHGMTRGGVRAGHRVLVTGAGPIGALSIAACRARGITDIVVSEPHPRRRALAERLGAVAISPDELPTPAMPFDVVDEPFDVALECSGHARAMEACLAQLRPAGALVLVGAGMHPPKFDPNRIILNELSITGAFVYDPDGFQRALELLASPEFPTELLIESQDVPLDGLPGAVDQLVAGEIPGKVLIAPRGGAG